MPSNRRQIIVRADDAQRERWVAEAERSGSRSLNAWIVSALDAASEPQMRLPDAPSEPPPAPVPVRAKPSQKEQAKPSVMSDASPRKSAFAKKSDGCPMPTPKGTKCKFCGRMH